MFRDEDQLENLLSEPSPLAVETLAKLDGDLILLGVGGKMGPTLARMARRAFDAAGVKRTVYGAARFSQPGLFERLQQHGVEPIRCDLLDADEVRKLPDVPNVIAMTGMKFGSSEQASMTWAQNCHVPSLVCEKFQKSRLVAFSTGNVYGMTPVERGGSREGDAPAPVGEYSQSALGRERMYEYYSRKFAMPMALLRLNYATEMRYGVLVDVAQRVFAGRPVDVTMGFLNALWQGDANAMTLCAFGCLESPPKVLNLAGPEILSVREVAAEFGQRFGKPAVIEGKEAADAFLSNAQASHSLFGAPQVSAQRLVGWIADWVARGGRTLGKPTHFEVRDGKF
ncbi:MAG: NAD-dependent epimerase/dehydratase family protein [Gemmataceae bacterium]|nr:NAD-dependent epimerase/dehydratase family protein [Gemmataceae bacterium]